MLAEVVYINNFVLFQIVQYQICISKCFISNSILINIIRGDISRLLLSTPLVRAKWKKFPF